MMLLIIMMTMIVWPIMEKINNLTAEYSLCGR